jgi:hypothetical protein
VERWVKPEEFVEHARAAEQIGFAGVMAGPLVRCSYRAGRLYAQSMAHHGRTPPPAMAQLAEEGTRARGESGARTSDRRSRQVDRPTWRATGVHPSSLFRYRPNRPIPIKTRCQNTTELMKTVVGQRKTAGDSTADRNASPRGVAIDNPGGEAADVAHAGRAERRA